MLFQYFAISFRDFVVSWFTNSQISQAKGNSNSTLYVKQYDQKCDIQYITGLVYIHKNNSQETLPNVQNVDKNS